MRGETPTSPRLCYRAPAAADLARHFEIHGDPETNRFNPAGPVRSLEDSKAILDAWVAHWAEHGFGQWAIATAAAPDRLIGFGGVAYRDYAGVRHLNLGFRLAPEAWGRGYATEVGRTALAFAFETLGMDAVHALVRPANAASIKVLEKLGMKRSGLLDDVPGEAQSFVYRLGRHDGA